MAGRARRVFPLNRPSFLDAFGFRFVLPFELDWGQHPIACVLPGGAVEHLDVVEHVPACLVARAVDLAADAFALEQVDRHSAASASGALQVQGAY